MKKLTEDAAEEAAIQAEIRKRYSIVRKISKR
jgi:hypothetical protein